MRTLSMRTRLIAILALGGALIWGAIELLALQLSRWSRHWSHQGSSRPF
ncbi:MAG: hypothetical protein HXX12_01650 [Geothrix sp.]|nr:hypothetical protein [Geothrix sp.]NWJ39657.1 hypothetical protein [Geothrix sp.]WIL22323.1 MAG: hypothetical protein QOZ81_001622 [Geothrix sp.]